MISLLQIHKSLSKYRDEGIRFKALLKRCADAEIKLEETRESNRKIVNSINLETFDPLVMIPEELHDLVIQHFDGNDVLKASEVSKDWFNLTTASKKCVSKLKLMIISYKNISEKMKLQMLDDMKMLQDSARRYQHVQLTGDYNDRDTRWQLSMGMECANLLKAHAESITSLMIHDIRTNRYESEVIPLVNLEHLEYSGEDQGPFKHLHSLILTATCNLKYLDAQAYDQNLRECLKQNTKLEELRLSDEMVKDLFVTDLADKIKFKLKNLISKTIENLRYNEHNYIKFLASQGESLEFIKLHFTSSNVISTVFKEMKVLKRVELWDFKGGERYIEPTENVFQLELHYIPWDKMILLLRALPNLEWLRIDHLNKHIVEFAANNLFKLKLIIYNKDSDQTSIEYYEELRLSTADVNKDISIQTSWDYFN